MASPEREAKLEEIKQAELGVKHAIEEFPPDSLMSKAIMNFLLKKVANHHDYCDDVIEAEIDRLCNIKLLIMRAVRAYKEEVEIKVVDLPPDEADPEKVIQQRENWNLDKPRKKPRGLWTKLIEQVEASRELLRLSQELDKL